MKCFSEELLVYREQCIWSLVNIYIHEVENVSIFTIIEIGLIHNRALRWFFIIILFIYIYKKKKHAMLHRGEREEAHGVCARVF